MYEFVYALLIINLIFQLLLLPHPPELAISSYRQRLHIHNAVLRNPTLRTPIVAHEKDLIDHFLRSVCFFFSRS